MEHVSFDLTSIVAGVAGFMALIAGLLYRLWRSSEHKREEAERKAKTQLELREIERDAREKSPDDLADSISRKH